MKESPKKKLCPSTIVLLSPMRDDFCTLLTGFLNYLRSLRRKLTIAQKAAMKRTL